MDQNLRPAEIEEQARRLWPTVLAKAGGLDAAQSYELSVLKTKSSEDVARAVMLARPADGSSVVYKYEPAFARSDTFQTSVAVTQKVDALMRGSDNHHVASLLWSSDALGVQVIQHVSGATAFDRIDWADPASDVRSTVICDCAKWLAELHGADEGALSVEIRVRWAARMARRLSEQVRDKGLNVGAPKMFLGLCAMIHRLVREVEGHEALRVCLHGDPHLANFIYGGDGLYAIDVTGRGIGAAEQDIARFITRLFYKFGAADADFAGVSSSDWESFAAGYGEDLRASPMLTLCIAIQILRDWSIISKADLVPGSPRQRRFAAIRKMFRALRDAGY